MQLGFGAAKPKRLNKPKLGHLKKAGAPPMRHLHEFASDELGDERRGRRQRHGGAVRARPDASGSPGTSKGKGYAGTIKRHNFKRGPVSHGSHNIRAPGSIGAAAYPARVFKGMRMSGQMGNARVTQRGLQVVDGDPERNLLLVRGAVPGGVNGT